MGDYKLKITIDIGANDAKTLKQLIQKTNDDIQNNITKNDSFQGNSNAYISIKFSGHDYVKEEISALRFRLNELEKIYGV